MHHLFGEGESVYQFSKTFAVPRLDTIIDGFPQIMTLFTHFNCNVFSKYRPANINETRTELSSVPVVMFHVHYCTCQGFYNVHY